MAVKQLAQDFAAATKRQCLDKMFTDTLTEKALYARRPVVCVLLTHRSKELTFYGATNTESGQTSNLRHHCGRKKIMQERDQRRLTRIIKRDKRATLPQIAADFNPVPSTSVAMRTI
ncbi:uncharacterized protein TNCV_2911791 [Trichonephila clavipes]|nr:uncharacterized protein TNCV_2911791 [Trichonephila clavipes]